MEETEHLLKVKAEEKFKQAFAFDDVSLVPAETCLDPECVDYSVEIGGKKLQLPLLASAMDAVVDVAAAVQLTELGAMGVLNLEGVAARYEEPKEALEKIRRAPRERAVEVLQAVYQKPVQEGLVVQRIEELKKRGAVCAVSVTPPRLLKFLPLFLEHPPDLLFVQSTITTANYVTDGRPPLKLEEAVHQCPFPVFAGNCVTRSAAQQLMEAGVAGILVGLGPGAACTTRRVTGVGVPQVTAIYETSRAREDFFQQTGTYVPIIADGGMRTGGDIAKAIASGADAVMIGSPLAASKEAPGRGFHWGMATSHAGLPRGTRVEVGVRGSLTEILLGPAHVDDGTMNLFGALRQAMGMCGARTIKEMQEASFVIAASVRWEGKALQVSQGVGHGR